MVKDCLKHMQATGEWVGNIHERSAVGEPQSNGRAERNVQQIQDHMQCLNAELEYNIKAKIPSTHSVLKLLVDYDGSIICK